tara:strand:- start:164 stop:409 length:246 start_codon:yes stop_codon:yes gene_type:complete
MVLRNGGNMRKTETEYEVCEVDENGDIQEVHFYKTKPQAVKDWKDRATSHDHAELWRVKWSYTDVDGGEDPDREQELVSNI